MNTKQITVEQAIARLTEAARQEPAPVSVTVGPISLPWAALLWQVSRETRLSVQQAAEALNVTKGAIYQLVASGRLPRVKIGGRLTFTAAQLRAYIADNEVRS